jgi:hypothetical protein
MQLNSVYLYPNKIDVFTNTLASWQLERYRRVYNRNLKIYRSVDNRIDLQVRNSDQKSTDITGSVLVFNIITREANDLVVKKDCVTVAASTGKVYATITRADLLDLEPGFYNYTVVQEIREAISATEYRVTSRTPMYMDSQYGVVGTMEVSGDTESVAEQSLNVSTFAYINPGTTGYTDPKYYVSSLIDCKGQLATPQSLHSFQFYTTNYTGTVIIQGSIDDGATPKNWVDLSTQTVTNSNVKYSNIVGKWNFFRIKHLPTTGTVDKVLYR